MTIVCEMHGGCTRLARWLGAGWRARRLLAIVVCLPFLSSVQVGRAAVAIVGSWTGETLFETNGFNYTPGAGSNRIALIMISSESTTNPVANIGSVTLGGQTVTAIQSADGIVVGPAGAFHNVLWLGYLNESGIVNMSGSALSITWDQAPNNPDGGETLVQAATYENVHQTTPVADSASNTNTSASSIQAGSVSVGPDDRLVYAALIGTGANHTAPGGYTEQLEQDDLSYSHASAQRDATTASSENPTATWSTTQRLAIISAVVNFSGCDYVESFQSWTATSADTWETKDLSGAPFNVPANAVLEVEIRNSDTSSATSRWGGVRAVGSSLDRRFDLHQPWQDGIEPVVMHVQSDGSSRIQHYSENIGFVDFVLLGYWECGTYVEAFDTFTAGASAAWTDKNLCSLGVSVSHVAEIVIANNGASGRSVGVRTNGSAVDRRFTLDRGFSGADNVVTMFVEADTSPQSTIELYTASDADVDFYLVGYWSVAPRAYTELFIDVGSPTASATWQDKDLTASGVPDTAIAEFVLANEYTGVAPTFGVRANGSSLSRLVQTHRIANAGANVDRLHVVTDASATIEWYHSDITRANSFYLVGYWDSCDSAIEYVVADLGAVTAANDSMGQHINASGDVGGFEENVSGDPDAWFSECGSFTTLGVLGGSDAEALGINDAEMVVGWSDDGSGNRRAFTWTSGGGLTDLGTIATWSDSQAHAVNSSSEVVGTVVDFGAPPERRMAFLYLPAPAYTLSAGMNALGTLGGVQSIAMDINDSGQVTGGAQNGGGQFLRNMRPFRWSNTTMTDLGTLGGENESTLHRGQAINSAGDVVGLSYTASGDAHGFYWDGSMTDMSVLTGGDTSWALGINDSDVAVGTSNVSGGAFHAFVWDSANGMRDLNDLIDSGSGWTLTRATDINNSGQITGWGTNGSGDVRAFLLTQTCSAGGGGAVASFSDGLLVSGFGVTDQSGFFEEVAVSQEGEQLAEIVIEASAGTTVDYVVSESDVDLVDGPRLATLEGFLNNIALPRTITVQSSAPDGSFKMVIRYITNLDELTDLAVNPEDIELHVLETTQGVSAGVWRPAGKNIGEAAPTGIVGDSGFVVYTDGSVEYWAVRNKPGVFAVGQAMQDDVGTPRPISQSPGPTVCGLGMALPLFMGFVGYLIERRGPRRACARPTLMRSKSD